MHPWFYHMPSRLHDGQAASLPCTWSGTKSSHTTQTRYFTGIVVVLTQFAHRLSGLGSSHSQSSGLSLALHLQSLTRAAASYWHRWPSFIGLQNLAGPSQQTEKSRGQKSTFALFVPNPTEIANYELQLWQPQLKTNQAKWLTLIIG